MIDQLKKNKVSSLTTIILLLGLVFGIILIKRQQIFKSKASSDINNIIEVTSDNGPASFNQEGNTFEVISPVINLKLR